jgi:hypothetical protein
MPRPKPSERCREISSRGHKDLAPDEVVLATDATDTYDLQRPHELQP